MVSAPVSDLQNDTGVHAGEAKDLLRLVTAGSVDDGKSTLIGRLLYDSQSVYEDQLQSVTKTSAKRGAGTLDLSLLTDGLRAEREQGITIDVAYRYFATAKRKFILADTPGHVQYTRNMATGASTAELAIILIDARHGVQEQSRRHAYILSLLGISHLVVAVNKMDLVGYSAETYSEIQKDFNRFLSELRFEEVHWTPISALTGDNVVDRSQNMPWFTGQPILAYLEQVEVHQSLHAHPFRFPVQRVVRPTLDFRGYSGLVASGTIHKGSQVKILPSGHITTVKSISTFDGEIESAFSPMPVTLQLADEIDISRGDLICSVENGPHVSSLFTANVVWFGERPLEAGRKYLFKHTSRIMRAEVRALRHRVNIQTFEQEPAQTLSVNEIGVVEIKATQHLFFDAYPENRTTGSAILIDPDNNLTVGAVMLIGPTEGQAEGSAKVATPVTDEERVTRFGHRSAILNLAGREKAAYILERKLFDLDVRVVIVRSGEEQSVAAFIKAGFVVISLTRDVATTVPLHGVSQDNDEEAADTIFDLLLEAHVLLKA